MTFSNSSERDIFLPHRTSEHFCQKVREANGIYNMHINAIFNINIDNIHIDWVYWGNYVLSL